MTSRACPLVGLLTGDGITGNTNITVISNFGAAVGAVCSSTRRGQKAETSTKTPVQDVVAHAYVQCPLGCNASQKQSVSLSTSVPSLAVMC